VLCLHRVSLPGSGDVRQVRESNQTHASWADGLSNRLSVWAIEVFADAALAWSRWSCCRRFAGGTPEEADEVPQRVSRRGGLDVIFLAVAHHHTAAGCKICRHASCYVYYVSLKGVTGPVALNVTECGSQAGSAGVPSPICDWGRLRYPRWQGQPRRWARWRTA